MVIFDAVPGGVGIAGAAPAPELCSQAAVLDQSPCLSNVPRMRVSESGAVMELGLQNACGMQVFRCRLTCFDRWCCSLVCATRWLPSVYSPSALRRAQPPAAQSSVGACSSASRAARRGAGQRCEIQTHPHGRGAEARWRCEQLPSASRPRRRFASLGRGRVAVMATL